MVRNFKGEGKLLRLIDANKSKVKVANRIRYPVSLNLKLCELHFFRVLGPFRVNS